jgi:hypothetical protein
MDPLTCIKCGHDPHGETCDQHLDFAGRCQCSNPERTPIETAAAELAWELAKVRAELIEARGRECSVAQHADEVLGDHWTLATSTPAPRSFTVTHHRNVVVIQTRDGEITATDGVKVATFRDVVRLAVVPNKTRAAWLCTHCHTMHDGPCDPATVDAVAIAAAASTPVKTSAKPATLHTVEYHPATDDHDGGYFVEFDGKVIDGPVSARAAMEVVSSLNRKLATSAGFAAD